MKIKWTPSHKSVEFNILYLERRDIILYDTVPGDSLKEWCNTYKCIPEKEDEYKFICELVNSRDRDNYIIAFEIITNLPDEDHC